MPIKGYISEVVQKPAWPDFPTKGNLFRLSFAAVRPAVSRRLSMAHPARIFQQLGRLVFMGLFRNSQETNGANYFVLMQHISRIVTV
jgi:hypothetical protein